MTDGPPPSLNVLIVEDEALLAMDVAALLEDCGHQVVGEAASVPEVAALPLERPVDCAFVDIQLLHGTSGLDAAALLRARMPDIAIVFVTANPKKVPDGFDGAIGIIPKPFSRAGMVAAIRYVADRLTTRAPSLPQPSSFLPLPTTGV